MHYSFDAINDLLAMLFFSFTLRDKLDEIQNLAVEEEEYVFDLERALAQPRIPLLHVVLLRNARLQLTTLIIIVLFLGTIG